MVDRCCCFTTDSGYLFPTVLSAIQARKFLDHDIADVVIMLFGADPVALKVFSEICQRNGIRLMVCDPEMLQGYSTMYARLFLSKTLSQKYLRVLYVDGDTQVTRSLNTIMQAELPNGHAFAAVADPMAVLQASKSGDAAIQSYFDGLGVENSPARPYFNSGVMLIDLAHWAAIERDALACLRDRPELCLFQDQSALNFAGHQNFSSMSFRWNFPIFFRNCGVERTLRPRVYHFMSKPKPWQGVFPPWNRSFAKPYRDLIAQHPETMPFSEPLSLPRHIRYLLQQNIKRLQETVTWRYSRRREFILEFDAAAKL